MAFRFQAVAAALIAVSLPAQIAAQASAPPPAISLEQRTLLRCAAAFALVAHDQAAGDPGASKWPDLRERGREFFVRASAQLMDEAGLTRAQVAALMEEAARDFRQQDTLDRAMPPCLLTLEASGI
ncbi:hypothetical protein MKP08_00775 [Erythrobacter sp. LQ02-29]|uniref:hypothetical protein n=1 Tax=Erythrobacter sp. LQ02-29 TaxID=2920384 RepID=UPI001F4DB101|nr:hypothetical protein [Erythrobacter sp. LQ02-29]MCP9221283.1 hypothetical protein [Erythrobacter sp. LQ02-29]